MRTGEWSTCIVETTLPITRGGCLLPDCVQPPEGAEVVVSNTYPNDVSLTFARTKGMAPLHAWATPHATRIAVAACTEGLGRHNLFPLANFPDPVWFRAVAQRASVMRFADVGKKLARRIARPVRPQTAERRQRPPIWLYCTGNAEKLLRCSLPRHQDHLLVGVHSSVDNG